MSAGSSLLSLIGAGVGGSSWSSERRGRSGGLSSACGPLHQIWRTHGGAGPSEPRAMSSVGLLLSRLHRSAAEFVPRWPLHGEVRTVRIPTRIGAISKERSDGVDSWSLNALGPPWGWLAKAAVLPLNARLVATPSVACWTSSSLPAPGPHTSCIVTRPILFLSAGTLQEDERSGLEVGGDLRIFAPRLLAMQPLMGPSLSTGPTRSLVLAKAELKNMISSDSELGASIFGRSCGWPT